MTIEIKVDDPKLFKETLGKAYYSWKDIRDDNQDGMIDSEQLQRAQSQLEQIDRLFTRVNNSVEMEIDESGETTPVADVEFSIRDRLIGRDGREWAVEDITMSLHDGNVFYELSHFNSGEQKTLIKSLVERDYRKV